MTPYTALVGKRFDNFTLLKADSVDVELLCHSCGHPKVYKKCAMARISQGLLRHCGCEKKKPQSLTGQEVNGYTVQELRTGGRYQLRCLTCSKTKTALPVNILNKTVPSCRCHLDVSVGQTLGEFVVVKAPERINGVNMVTVRCSYCMTVFQTNLYNARNKLVKSCGCLTQFKKPAIAQPYSNLVGRQFGELRVMECVRYLNPENTEKELQYIKRWKVRCSCGNEREFSNSHLIGAHPPQHCGCKKTSIKKTELTEKLHSLIDEMSNLNIPMEKAFEHCSKLVS
jgi:hypothetical protein